MSGKYNQIDELNLDTFRENLTKFTERAFRMIPPLKCPTILDIGCGTGVPTLILAELSDGLIVAIDIDEDALNKFREKCIKLGLGDKISIQNMSMKTMDFQQESFDIIWSEGSIFAVGFNRGLREWKPMIKKRGYLVIHDQDDNRERKREDIIKQGFSILGEIEISHESWWNEYYRPLEKYIGERRSQISVHTFNRILSEIRTFTENPVGSIYFVLKK